MIYLRQVRYGKVGGWVSMVLTNSQMEAKRQGTELKTARQSGRLEL